MNLFKKTYVKEKTQKVPAEKTTKKRKIRRKNYILLSVSCITT